MPHLVPLACLLILVTPAAPLAAQARQPLDSGTVARLRWQAGGRTTARLLAPLDSTTATVRFCNAAAVVCGPGTINPPQERARSALAGVDIRGRRKTVDGAVTGALIGAAFGLLGFWGAGLSDAQGGLANSHPALVLPVAALFGAGIGAGIGAVSRRWEPAP